MAARNGSPTSPMYGRSHATCPRAIPIGSSWPPKPGNNPERNAMSLLRRALQAGIAAALLIAGTARGDADDVPLQLSDSQLEPIKWGELAGWGDDDHLAAFAAFRTSCQPFRMVRRPRD